MSRPKIYAHGSYVGDTGYNQHTRDFFRHLDKHADIKVRNFTVGKSWNGYNENAHDNEHYFNKIDNVNGLEENQSRLIEILETQYNWNFQNKLIFTPAIIINDFHFPKEYNRSDLIYFIEELADDEGFNL
jgi:hypothetical protein